MGSRSGKLLSAMNQRIIEEVKDLALNFSNTGQAFVAWYLLNYRDVPEGELETLVSDGSGDVGIDAVYFDERNLEIQIIQGKFSETENAPSLTVEEISKTLDTSERLRTGKPTAGNKKVKSLLKAAREKLSSQDSGWTVRSVLLTNKDFAADVFERCENDPNILLVGGQELEKELFNDEIESPRIEDELKYIPGQAYLSEQPTGRVYVCTVSGLEIANLYTKHGRDLFWRNIRFGLASKPVNKGISETIQNSEQKQYFWLFNNGITIVCDQLEADEAHSSIRMKNISIINGAQTTSTLAGQKHHLKGVGVQLMVRIIELKKAPSQLIQDIVKFNNKQTATISQDFISNNPDQIKLAAKLKLYKYFYDYKRGLWEGKPSTIRKKFTRMKVTDLAYGVLAFHDHPGEARNDRKNYFVMEPPGYYNLIFNDKRTVEEYIFLYELLTRTKKLIATKRAEDPNYGYGYLTSFLMAVMGSIYRAYIEKNITFKNIVKQDEPVRNEFFNQLLIAGLETTKLLIREERRDQSFDIDNFTKGRRVNEIAGEADVMLSERDKQGLDDFYQKYKNKFV